MTIHQKCYDLSQIPAGDWICDLCRSFGSRGKYMPCPFCSRTGGAMKPTDYLKTQNIPNTNQNSNFHDFILKCLKSEKDFYSKKVWVHLSCALWMPGIYFEETNEIKGFDNVETWRFNIICEICKMVKVGAVIQCAYKECPRFFHVECGRRIGLYLENIEHNYLLYCQKHKPYKLKIVQITRFSKARDEITRYFKQLYRKPTDFRYNEKIKQNEIYTNSLFLINLKKIEGNYQVQKVFCPTLKKYNDQKQILKNIPIKNNSYLLNIDESTINADKKKTRDDNKKKNLFKAVKEKKTLQKQIQAKKIIFRKETRLNLRKIIKKSNKDGKKNNPIKIESELISIDYSTRLNNNDCQIIISLDNNNTSEINNVNSKLIGYELDKLNCICLEKCDYLKNNVIICMVCERKFHFKCIGFKGTLKDASDLKFVCKSCDLYGNFFARNVRRKLCCDFFENYYEDIDEKEKKRWGNALQELNSIDDNYWASEIEICMENSETEIDYKSEEKSKECENLSLSSLSLTS